MKRENDLETTIHDVQQVTIAGMGAILVAFFIFYVSWEIAHPALQELIDAGIDDKSAQVTAVAAKVPGVVAVHQARARRYGGAFQMVR